MQADKMVLPMMMKFEDPQVITVSASPVQPVLNRVMQTE